MATPSATGGAGTSGGTNNPATPPAAPGGGSTTAAVAAAGGSGSAPAPQKEERRGRHPANAFILYYQEMRKRNKGNIFMKAKEYGERWKTLSWDQKSHYRSLYLQNRLAYGSKARGYSKPNQTDKWKQWPKVARRNAYVSRKKKLEMRKQAALEEALRKKKDSNIQCDI